MLSYWPLEARFQETLLFHHFSLSLRNNLLWVECSSSDQAHANQFGKKEGDDQYQEQIEDEQRLCPRLKHCKLKNTNPPNVRKVHLGEVRKRRYDIWGCLTSILPAVVSSKRQVLNPTPNVLKLKTFFTLLTKSSSGGFLSIESHTYFPCPPQLTLFCRQL